MTSVDEKYRMPVGNWMARKLRLVNDESKTLFPPKTSSSRKSYKKYDTVYKRDYKESPNFNPKDHQKKFEAKRETVQDVVFSGGLDPIQMFLHWKIPDRILEGSTSPSLASVTTPDLIRSSTLPEIGLSNHVHRPRPASQASVKRTPTRALGTPVSSARLFREQNHSKDLWALQVERTNNTKKSIARRMFTHDDQKHIMVNKIRKTLDPESRKYVDKWLETASEEDKQMAIKLFSTLDNNNLPDTEKQMRIEGVLKLIKRRSNGFTSYSSPDLSTNLKHLRLQDPHTRTNRWMHTTWHHLPQYLDTDPVNNTSSMYTKPHEPIPHDFVIHPDWG